MKKYEYPIITKENFEEITKRLVFRDKWWIEGWKSYDQDNSIRVRKPQTRNDFYEMTKNMFGIGLTFTGYSGSYKIVGSHDEYSKGGIASLWEKKYGQYNGLKIFLNRTFGNLYCGGVASSHYGQYNTQGYHDKMRLKKLYDSVLSINSNDGSNQT